MTSKNVSLPFSSRAGLARCALQVTLNRLEQEVPMRYALSALLVIGLAGCQSMPSTESTKAEVAQAAQNWASAFNGCDSVKATALYDSEAVLWNHSASHHHFVCRYSAVL